MNQLQVQWFLIMPWFIVWDGIQSVGIVYGRWVARNMGYPTNGKLNDIIAHRPDRRIIDCHVLSDFKNLPFNFESRIVISAISRFAFHSLDSPFSAAPASTLPAMDASNSTRNPWTEWAGFLESMVTFGSFVTALSAKLLSWQSWSYIWCWKSGQWLLQEQLQHLNSERSFKIKRRCCNTRTQ